ncbi:hypothetical protein GCK72_016612 [Caenorhabditis remanei]|uniref:Uncharacterized protein n=1 Tax=Caenorhabditis remanei TaxID=31234 RepID=E3MTR2_CAERE|nr:hypothetical protein GCK72_016612 [Caenorhabditis remanei]EFP08863.1 hypothetical protein CRE_18055 [Caenorhabditis remanei]KAF1750066.1 hypothetical protein GCK72_016612 [Caenorhabditis remanei]
MTETESFNYVDISIENHTYIEWWTSVLITVLLICILVSCGSWCIYAAGKISEESTVYHFEREFKPDNDDSKSKYKRKGAGACRIEIEYERDRRDFQAYLVLAAKSFIVWGD